MTDKIRILIADSKGLITTARAASGISDAGCAFVASPPVAAPAKTMSIGIMALANSHHCSALSVQLKKITTAGMIGLLAKNTQKAIAPRGTKDPFFGTNPIAFTTPHAIGPPTVISDAKGTVLGAIQNIQGARLLGTRRREAIHNA